MKDSKRQQIESNLLDAIDLALESFYCLCTNLNLLYAYQFATEYHEDLIYPNVSFSMTFQHLSKSVSMNLCALKNALDLISSINSTL